MLCWTDSWYLKHKEMNHLKGIYSPYCWVLNSYTSFLCQYHYLQLLFVGFFTRSLAFIFPFKLHTILIRWQETIPYFLSLPLNTCNYFWERGGEEEEGEEEEEKDNNNYYFQYFTHFTFLAPPSTPPQDCLVILTQDWVAVYNTSCYI